MKRLCAPAFVLVVIPLLAAVPCGTARAQEAATTPPTQDAGATAQAQDRDTSNGLLIQLWGITPQIRQDRVEYGQKLVQHLGCLFCHGLGGRKGIVNPDAERGRVPAWDAPDFAKRYPTPDKLLETIHKGRHPDKAKDATGNPIPMPPWGNRLSDGEIDAIVAYIWSLRDTPVSSHPKGGLGTEDAREAYLPPIHVAPAPAETDEEEHAHTPPFTSNDPKVREGRSMVEYLGCLHCHGAGGREGMENPNAKRKHVPSWDDPEFIRRYPVDDGVRWVIANGRKPERDPDATDEPVPMPPFGGLLTKDEMDAIVAYIWSLRETPAAAGAHKHAEAAAGHDH